MDNETGGAAERVINAAESEFAVRANYWAALNPLIAPIRPNPSNGCLQQHGFGNMDSLHAAAMVAAIRPSVA
jgi:hypothetical protein